VKTIAPEPRDAGDSPGVTHPAELTRDALLAVLGHELRTPLAPIRNAVHLLREWDLPPEKRERVLAILDRQLTHLSRLVGALVDGSRLARGRLALQHEEIDFARVVREETEDLRGVAEARGVAIELDVTPQPVMVRGDPVRLAQVVGNLVQNGLRFTDRGGHVTVHLDAAPGERALLRVSDDGIGMTRETLAHLFEPFATADHTLARARGGLGMGLAVVRGLVELHGGTVKAESAGVGEGATFTVHLPIAASRAAAPRRVLIVEDNRDSALTLADLLMLHGYQVAIAEDGHRGVAEARRLRPEVIVCDVGLPGELDGYAVARAIRADATLGATMLVALSGYTTPEHRARALRAGFDAHLAKPADVDELYRLLEEGRAAAPPT
jgi:CheY-like chemotaxis protein/two-component sensor histidine kinase